MLGDCQRFLVFLLQDEAGEFLGACHIRALPDIHKVQVAAEGERLEAREVKQPGRLPRLARLESRCGLGKGGNVLRSRSAASTGNVEEPVPRVLLDLSRHLLGRLVIPAHLVREAGVWIDASPNRRHAGKRPDKGPHLGGTEGAVQADRQESWRMLDGMPERLCRLSRERPAAQVHNGPRDHHG